MSAFLTHDLRGIAKDYSRVKAHNVKWSRGAACAPGTRCTHTSPWSPSPICAECGKRPVSRESGRNYTAVKQAMNRKATAQSSSASKKTIRSEIVDAVDDVHDHLSDSSGDVDVNDGSAAPDLNEVMYSFDARSSPSQGNDILSHAITQAVHRFENNETEKMVKQEYDLVPDGKEEIEAWAAKVDDDDFEIIEDVHWK